MDRQPTLRSSILDMTPMIHHITRGESSRNSFSSVFLRNNNFFPIFSEFKRKNICVETYKNIKHIFSESESRLKILVRDQKENQKDTLSTVEKTKKT